MATSFSRYGLYVIAYAPARSAEGIVLPSTHDKATARRPHTEVRAVLTDMTRHDVVNYPPRQASVTAARRRAAWLAVAWGYPEAAADVALVTSELATNALLHGSISDRFIRVEVSLADHAMRIAVTDPKGERRPELQEAGADRRFGRGLHVVFTLSDDWGVTDRTVGKTVWAELALQQPQRAPSGP